MDLWSTVTPRDSTTSNWLLFENGYDYATGEILQRGTYGESEQNPV